MAGNIRGSLKYNNVYCVWMLAHERVLTNEAWKWCNVEIFDNVKASVMHRLVFPTRCFEDSQLAMAGDWSSLLESGRVGDVFSRGSNNLYLIRALCPPCTPHTQKKPQTV